MTVRQFKKYLMTFEMLLVVFPCGFWLIHACIAYLAAWLTLDFLDPFVAVLALLRNVYFCVPQLVAPSMFDSHPFIVQPHGLLGWATVIATYAVVALVLAAAFSAFDRHPEEKQDAEHQPRPYC